MKTQVEFWSADFPAYAGEEEQVNPGVWGKRLAEYLAEQLASMEIDAGPITGEDWGWYLPLRIDDVRLALCCGHQDGDPEEFIVFTEPSTPLMRRGLKRVDVTAQLQHLITALNDILTRDPGIVDVVWVDA